MINEKQNSKNMTTKLIFMFSTVIIVKDTFYTVMWHENMFKMNIKWTRIKILVLIPMPPPQLPDSNYFTTCILVLKFANKGVIF